jgi:hypothetical protein
MGPDRRRGDQPRLRDRGGRRRASFTTTLTVAVDTAAELDVSRSVPVLRDGAFVAG